MPEPIAEIQQEEDSRLATIISRVAALVAVAIAVLPPTTYLFLSYQSQTREISAEAEISANLLAPFAASDPQHWQDKRDSLNKFAEKDIAPTELPEARRIMDARNRVLAQSGSTLRQPVLTRSHAVSINGAAIAKVEVSRSLTSIASKAFLIALISMYLGFDAFAVLHTMPLRALRRLFTTLREEKERAEVTLASISDAVISTDSAGLIDYLNPAAQRLTGWPNTEAKGRPLSDVLRLADERTGDAVGNPLERLMHDETSNNLRENSQLVSRDGYSHFVEIAISSVWDIQRGVIGFVLILHDTTMARLAEQSIMEREERLRVVIDNATDAIITLDDAGRIETFNPAAERIFGFPAGEVYGWHLSALVPGVNPVHCLNKGKDDELAGRHRNGNTFSLEMSVSEALLGENKKLVAILRDITERKHAEERLTFLANYDSLTGLPNRSLFRDRLAQAMMRAHRAEKLVAILFLDLDRFKNINDSLGHDSGDALLKRVAERLMNVLRKSDTVSRFEMENADTEETTVARLGGDEFIIILEGVSHVDHVAMVAQKIIDTFNKPFSISDHEIFVSTSIGIAVFPHDDTDLDMLIKDADTAMYRAKEVGRNNYQFYTQDMNTSVHERLQMESLLRHALERRELSLHYQPQVDIATGKVVGVEALMRWQHPELGAVPPVKFIPILEETGMIIPVGEWALRTACAQLKSWQAAGLPALTVAVNLSARQFYQQGLAQNIGKILSETGLSPENLELEITESLLMEHSEASSASLAALKAHGIKISIDDFGTGYSSLSYLKRFPIDTLKIDQSFVRDITSNSDDAAITTGIIALAHSLQLSVIAEGVETPDQLDFLRTHGCDQFQGYYMSRPLPPAQLEEWLKCHSA